jgi:hypothetical protein
MYFRQEARDALRKAAARAARSAAAFGRDAIRKVVHRPQDWSQSGTVSRSARPPSTIASTTRSDVAGGAESGSPPIAERREAPEHPCGHR